MERVQAYLAAHLAEPFSLPSAARAAGVHPVHLSRSFRRFHGCTLTTWLRRERVLRACELIRSSDASLTRIAFSVGFTEQSHFCRSFRHVTGMTPRAYRSIAARLPTGVEENGGERCPAA